jgi:hypothetical protein
MNWLRRLFSSGEREDQAAEREEYDVPAPDEVERARETTFGSFYAGTEGTEAAEEELDEFKPPNDPAP